MSAFTPSRSGQVNGAGDARAIFLKQYGGEVLAAFREHNIAESRSIVRSIKNGKSAQFPAMWKATASSHTPGAEIDGQVINGNEVVIELDDMLIAPVFIANVDEAIAHFDFRGEYSFQCGAALAKKFDVNVLINIGLAARASATVTGGNGGSVITDADCNTNADSMIESIFDAVQALDEKDVPKNDRYVGLKPNEYYLLVNSGSKALHTDYNPEGNGSIASGKIFRIAGCELVMTNNLPSTNINTGDYQGNFSTTKALVWHRGAAGTVKLMDLSVESEYSARHQGTLIVAKMLTGHGVLRPECAVEIKTS